MRAFVLTAGYGTRLGEMTKAVPKPMLDVGGRPLVEHILCHLAGHGFRHVSMNVHFLPHLLRDHFGDGSALGLNIDWSHEPHLLGTAGGVRKMAARAGVAGTMLIHYGDVLTDQDFTAMLDRHRQRDALATTLVHRRPGSNSVVGFDDHGRVTAFLERPSEHERQRVDSVWVNSGICLCEPDVLDLIPPDTVCDLARDVFPKLLASGRFFAHPLTGYRCAVDSLDRLEQARTAIAERRCRISAIAAERSAHRCGDPIGQG